ncbi:MAG: CHAT domain-containing protein [Leptolyngbyaceae cyanobacterium CRU_2_3]|nr:CHAT domain-containing protein [Leptolyngbyaceae cyanobacterium CRU_2_3]
MYFNRFRSFFLMLVFTAALLISTELASFQAGLAQTPRPTGWDLVQQAQQHDQTGHYQQVISLLQQAAAEFAAQGDRLNQATALGNLAATYARLGQWQEANQSIGQSLSFLRNQSTTPEQQRILAQTLEIQGHLQLEQGQTQSALEIWSEAENHYRSLQLPDRLLQTQIAQSEALQILGLYPRACKLLLTALDLTAQTCDLSQPEWEAQWQTLLSNIAEPSQETGTLSAITRGMNALGHVLRVLGQLDASQQILSVAMTSAQKLGDPQVLAEISLHVGNTLRAYASQPALDGTSPLQFEQSALEAYQQADRLATQPETHLGAQVNQLKLLVKQQNLPQAIELWRSLQPQLNTIAPTHSSLFAKINLAQTLMELAQVSPDVTAMELARVSPDVTAMELARVSPDVTASGVTASGVTASEIHSLLTQTIQQTNQLGDPRLMSYALGSRGRLYELQRQWSEAEATTNQALGLAPPFQSADITYQFLWQLGRIHKAQGKPRRAVNDYSKAVKILGSLRGDLVALNPDVQFSFRERVEPIYRELVALLLKDIAPSQGDLSQARQVIESLQLAELDNFFRDACADTKPEMIDRIDRTAAVIYPIILSDRMEVIVALPNQPLHHYRTNRPQAELEQTFKQVRTALRLSAFPEERLPVAQKLYDWLIRPAEPMLAEANIQTLVFVLDGSLQNLPMAILHDGQRYLIESYNLALTPGLQLLTPQPLTKVKLSVLTGALTEARQGFSALPAVADEVKQIQTQLPTNTLLNRQFSDQSLQQQTSRTACFGGSSGNAWSVQF